MDARQLRWQTLEALRASGKGRLRYHTHWRAGEVRARSRRPGWEHPGRSRFARCGAARPAGEPRLGAAGAAPAMRRLMHRFLASVTVPGA